MGRCTRIHRAAGPVACLAATLWAHTLAISSAAEPTAQRGRGAVASNALAITSNGTVVAPGQAVTVRVSSPNNSRFRAVLVIGEGPIGTAGPLDLPAQFSLRVPADIPLRKYGVTALGVTPAGQQVAAQIEIDVERPDMPVRLSYQLRQLIFGAENEESRWGVTARFADGTDFDVTESTKVTYSSSDPNVATVDENGMVRSVAEGEADLIVAYGPAAAGIRATVPMSVPPSLLSVAPRSLDFGRQTIGSTTTRRMMVTNAGNDNLKILKVTVAGDYAATDNCADVSPLSPGASCAIDVTFGPKGTGQQPGTVAIKTDFHIFPPTFKLSGTGVR
jgi:hypothetical protein